jgi:hypothetical protein
MRFILLTRIAEWTKSKGLRILLTGPSFFRGSMRNITNIHRISIVFL